jgi:hypothetical protein
MGGHPRSRPIRSIIVRERAIGDVHRPLGGLGDKAVRVDAERRRLVAGLPGGTAVELREGREPLGQPADDPERERQPEHPRPDGRLGRAADRDPDRQRLLERPRVHASIGERRRRALGDHVVEPGPGSPDAIMFSHWIR